MLNEKLRWEKIKYKQCKTEKKKYWFNECEIITCKIDKQFVFKGKFKGKTIKELFFKHKSKTNVINYSVNKSRVRIETETQIYYFRTIK